MASPIHVTVSHYDVSKEKETERPENVGRMPLLRILTDSIPIVD